MAKVNENLKSGQDSSQLVISQLAILTNLSPSGQRSDLQYVKITDGPQILLLLSIEKPSMTETIWSMRPAVLL